MNYRSYSTVEIEIREFLATNTFAYAYVCLKRYVFNSIGVYGCERIWTFDRANYLTVIFTFNTAGRELIERDMPVFESPCFIIK